MKSSRDAFYWAIDDRCVDRKAANRKGEAETIIKQKSIIRRHAQMPVELGSKINHMLHSCGQAAEDVTRRRRGRVRRDAVSPGGGILDRLDSMIFAASVFFHLTRFWFANE